MTTDIRIGVDVGGTFTDTIVIDAKQGKILTYNKVSTNPRNPHKSVIQSIKKTNVPYKNPFILIHATTLATNLFRGQLSLEIPKIALITTKGFKDIIEIGRQRRPKLYDLKFSKPKPLIPRDLRFEVNERISFEGKIIKSLDVNEVEEIIRLIVNRGVECVAISLLHSYANPIHEKIIEETLTKMAPNLYVSASYRVDPEHREYERTSTTVINVALKPLIEKYLSTLINELKETSNQKLLIVQSNGGLASPEEVSELPISIIESGPVAGLMATKFIGELLQEVDLLGFDMGGTTAKAGTIINNQPVITNEYEVGGEAHMGRIIKGSGYPVRFPFIELSEVSAGGGTIIWVDEAGSLKVGPMSAGADPGPASYGKGGDQPTITDAHIVLGRLNPKNFLGGEMVIHADLAYKAFKEKVTDLIGLDPLEASIGSIKIINTIMSRGINIATIERGIDPRDLTLVAYGGAGPLHACELAGELGFKKVIVPPYPGLFSALGLLSVDVKYSGLKSIRKNLTEIDLYEVLNLFEELESNLFTKLKNTGLDYNEILVIRSIDMRYWGQGYELNIKVQNGDLSKEKLAEQFHLAHEDKYGYKLMGEEIELVNLRVDVIGVINKPRLVKLKKAKEIEPKPIDRREVYFYNTDNFEESNIYLRSNLQYGQIIYGPAIIEEYDSTIIIPPDWVGKIGEYGEIQLKKLGE